MDVAYPAMQLPSMAADDGLDSGIVLLKLDKAIAPFLVKLDISDGPVHCKGRYNR